MEVHFLALFAVCCPRHDISNKHSITPDPMKTNFKFFFYLIFYTALSFAMFYGLAEAFVKQHITFFSFGLLVIVVLGISGMMRSLDSSSAVAA